MLPEEGLLQAEYYKTHVDMLGKSFLCLARVDIYSTTFMYYEQLYNICIINGEEIWEFDCLCLDF